MRSHQPHRRLRVVATLLSILAAAAILVGPGLAGAGATKTMRIKTAHIAKPDKTVLVNAKGRTLYTLSAETTHRVICTKACLSLWFPLKIKKGVKPVGAAHLGVMKRKEGFRQVTLNGHPLYAFSGDTAKGQAKGEGFKDVGVWHVAAVKAATASPPPMTPPATTPADPPPPAYPGY